ncbi:unnamed protein product [Rhizophagus irregularis]|nr:unnamed protein product [Rhizophagus irregularis]
MGWYKKSADNGYELAIKRLDKLSENSLLETKEKDVELDSLTEEQIKQRMTQQLKLHHGLFLDGHSIQPSKQAVFVDDGDLCTNLYRGEPMVYININGFDSLTNLLTFDNNIFSDLQPFDICINFSIAEITYKGDLLESFSTYMEDVEDVEDDKDLHDLYGHIFANKFLVGGQLFIKNFRLASSKQIDVLKFYITWAYNSAKNNNATQFNDDTFGALYLETSNGVKLNTPKKLANWLNNLYQDNVIDIISYKNLRSISQLRKAKDADAEDAIFAANDSETQDEKNPGIANFESKLSLQEWVGDDLYVNLVKWIKDFHPFQGLVINQSHKIENSKKIAINIIEVPKVNISDKTYFEMINPTMKLENNLIFNNIFSMKDLNSFPFIKSNNKSYGDHIHVLFKYEQYEIRLSKDNIKPTKEFEQIIENALNNMKPLEALQDVFDEYGHLFPQRIILGRTLRNILPKTSSVDMFDNINLKSPIFELLDNLNISYLLTREGEVVEKNSLTNWIQNTNNLEIIELDDIIPFYKILEQQQQRKIDSLLKKSNDRKIIMTGITDLKDLDNDIEDYKRVNFESPLEDDDYEVFGSIISKNNSKLKEFYVNFGLFDFNGFVATIKKLEETIIVIKECYILWIVIGNPLKLSKSSNNEEFQVYYIEKSITLQPNKSVYNIKTPPLFLGNNILINAYHPSTNCEPNNIKLIEWKNESINVQIMKSTSNNSNFDDNNIGNDDSDEIDNDNDSDDIDNDSLTNIEMNLRICILSTYYNNLKIDNYREKKFSLDLIGYTLTKENLCEKLQDEMDKFDSIQNIIKYPIDYINYGPCPNCNQFNTDYTWCQSCNSKYFKQNFENWTSGNSEIDKLIQKAKFLKEIESYLIMNHSNETSQMNLSTNGRTETSVIDKYLLKLDTKSKILKKLCEKCGKQCKNAKNNWCESCYFNDSSEKYNLIQSQLNINRYDNELIPYHNNQLSTMNPHDAMSRESRDPFNVAQPSILSYLKFYHFSPNDTNYYLVTCTIISQVSSFDVQDFHDHDFFYQHPNDSNNSSTYHVKCKLLSHSLVENILNKFRGLEFDIKSLSLNQRLNLELTLKQKLKKLFCQHYDRNATFHDNNVNHLITTQPVPMADIQNYNNNSITQHGLDYTYYNTTAGFNNFSYNFTNPFI